MCWSFVVVVDVPMTTNTVGCVAAAADDDGDDGDVDDDDVDEIKCALTCNLKLE